MQCNDGHVPSDLAPHNISATEGNFAKLSASCAGVGRLFVNELFFENPNNPEAEPIEAVLAESCVLQGLTAVDAQLTIPVTGSGTNAVIAINSVDLRILRYTDNSFWYSIHAVITQGTITADQFGHIVWDPVGLCGIPSISDTEGTGSYSAPISTASPPGGAVGNILKTAAVRGVSEVLISFPSTQNLIGNIANVIGTGLA